MRIEKNYELTFHNNYRIKSVCNRAYFPESEEDFIEIFKMSTAKFILGGGYNVILTKSFYDQDFIIVNDAFSNIGKIGNRYISCEAGAHTKKFSEFACQHSLSGAEMFYDIPSTIGGAVVMNAGASGEEIKDILTKVRYLDLDDLEIKEIDKEDIFFSYRNSLFQKDRDKVVLKAWFKLEKGNKGSIRDKMETIKSKRWAKQPVNYPNAGSVFKRPKGYYVGQLIEELDLKGLQIGGAQISEKHGGFIINKGNATGEDIIDIINTVKNMVKDTYGVELEVEQRII